MHDQIIEIPEVDVGELGRQNSLYLGIVLLAYVLIGFAPGMVD